MAGLARASVEPVSVGMSVFLGVLPIRFHTNSDRTHFNSLVDRAQLVVYMWSVFHFQWDDNPQFSMEGGTHSKCSPNRCGINFDHGALPLSITMALSIKRLVSGFGVRPPKKFLTMAPVVVCTRMAQITL